MQDENTPLAGERLGLLGKGGSGKSSVTVLLARTFRHKGYRVVILDADSTNIGLHGALGLDTPPRPLLEYFGGSVFKGGRVTCPVDDPTTLTGATVQLDQLPREYYARTSDGIIFLEVGKIGTQGPGAGCDGPISKIARDFRIEIQGQSAVTIVDLKAGFEDAARGVITSLDWILGIIDPTSAALQMALHLNAMVNQIQAGALPATKHLEQPQLVQIANEVFARASIKGAVFALNKIRDSQAGAYLTSRLGEAGITPLGTIREDPSLSLSWLMGQSLEAPAASQDVSRIVEELEAQQRKFRPSRKSWSKLPDSKERMLHQ